MENINLRDDLETRHSSWWPTNKCRGLICPDLRASSMNTQLFQFEWNAICKELVSKFYMHSTHNERQKSDTSHNRKEQRVKNTRRGGRGEHYDLIPCSVQLLTIESILNLYNQFLVKHNVKCNLTSCAGTHVENLLSQNCNIFSVLSIFKYNTKGTNK